MAVCTFKRIVDFYRPGGGASLGPPPFFSLDRSIFLEYRADQRTSTLEGLVIDRVTFVYGLLCTMKKRVSVACYDALSSMEYPSILFDGGALAPPCGPGRPAGGPGPFLESGTSFPSIDFVLSEGHVAILMVLRGHPQDRVRPLRTTPYIYTYYVTVAIYGFKAPTHPTLAS